MSIQVGSTVRAGLPDSIQFTLFPRMFFKGFGIQMDQCFV